MQRAPDAVNHLQVLQRAVNQLSEWLKKTGLALSTPKSKLIWFSRRPCSQSPIITLNGTPLQLVTHHKILGLSFESRLTWKQHISVVKGNAMKRLNIIKALSKYTWGVDETILLNILYRALIRSKLDYSSFIYMPASKSDLKLLNSMHNTFIRLCLGAFKSSPIDSHSKCHDHLATIP
ncbi:uncharacterized protein [Diabrotica undecimpunctata]|uniref:uncharacterized protein n=1 Tax=Diabrotica undecimpunctata TaxID=50387 RepID=UPI003B63EE22